MKKFYSLLLLGSAALSFAGTKANAQGFYRVSDVEKVASSPIVVEGVVTKQQPFWNKAHTFIFTSNTVHVYKVFKGSVTTQDVEIVTQGGEIDGYSVSATDLLSLKQNEVGLFCCHPNVGKIQSPTTGNALLDVYAGAQGFFKYDMSNYSANAVLSTYNSITNGLYPRIQALIGQKYQVKDASFTADRKATNSTFGINPSPLAVPKITSFTPDSLYAGATLDPTHNTIKVRGAGFGTNTGLAALWFTATDYARWLVNYNDPLLVSWSDTLIVAKVPSTAGTGKIWVENSAGVFDSTSKLLNIPYSVQTATYKPIGSLGVTKELSLMNHNGSGGYTFTLSNSNKGGGMNFDSAARAIFARALDVWTSRTGYNGVVAPASTLTQTIAGDNINMVMFDNANTGLSPLPAGTLGSTYYYATICNPTATSGYKKVGFDILIRSNYSDGSTHFNFGPCAPIVSPDSVYDVESTIFHEIGHAIGLAHVNDPQEGTQLPYINPGAVMNGGLSDGVRKTSLDNSSIVGATYLVKPKKNGYGTAGCFGSPDAEMTPLTVKAAPLYDEFPTVFPVATSIVPGTTVPFDLVYATANKYTDPQPSAIDCSGNIMAITNNAYYPILTSLTGGNLDVTVSGYTTSPTDLANCNSAGVQLALYQLNSKPQAHNYPAPVACRKFNGDSALTTISGLEPNTSYLLFLEGINNTKANFSLVLGGAALPIKIESFTGIAAGSTNQLKWSINTLASVSKLTVEKSIDGVKFSELTSYTTNAKQYLNYTQSDYLPYAGTTYYRLAVTYSDGKKEYSTVVTIKRTDKIKVSLYPNPVKDKINLQISAAQALGNVQVKLINVLGQVVSSKTINVADGISSVQLPSDNIAKGYYHVIVIGKDNTILQNINLEKL